MTLTTKRVDPTPVLDRIDKNGSKHYHSNACPKCGGTGYLHGYEHVHGGICFKCDGSGYHPTSWIERTPEYEAKLAERRVTRLRKTADQRNAKMFSAYGLSPEGTAWIVVGNTFEIKESIKEAGGRYNNLFGWHFDHEVTEFDTIKVSVQDLCDLNETGDYTLEYEALEVSEKIKALLDARKLETSTSEYIGAVGDRIELIVKHVSTYTYSTNYTYYGETHYIHKFDCDGNVIIWKTSSDLGIDDLSQALNIRGTIKAHDEYRGDRQTVLTRCKITEIPA